MLCERLKRARNARLRAVVERERADAKLKRADADLARIAAEYDHALQELIHDVPSWAEDALEALANAPQGVLASTEAEKDPLRQRSHATEDEPRVGAASSSTPARRTGTGDAPANDSSGTRLLAESSAPATPSPTRAAGRRGRPLDPTTLDLIRYLAINRRPDRAALARIVAGHDSPAARNRATTRVHNLQTARRIRWGADGWEVIDFALLKRAFEKDEDPKSAARGEKKQKTT